MKKILLLSLLLSLLLGIKAQDIRVQTFGDKANKALLFLHGGPGYNSVSFERTTAEKLAENGFFVISYDRRGEGRNASLEAAYTFEETFKDINALLQKLSVEKVSLIGHSFGGVVATLFADKYLEKVTTILLVGVPISMQETLKNILDTSKKIYIENDDKVNLNYIKILEGMDSTSLAYSSYCFMHAMQNGFYATKTPNPTAVDLYSTFKTDELLKKYATKMGYRAPQGFWKNEKYTTISIQENIERLQAKKCKVYGFYGKEDGLYSAEQVQKITTLLGAENVKYIENCSHSAFIDQQKIFIDAIKKWVE